MSSTSSPVSPIDKEKAEALSGVDHVEPTAVNITTDSGRLHALEQIEILPQILREGILFAGSGAALLLQAALPDLRNLEAPSGNADALITELLDALQAHLSYISILVFGTRAERQNLLNLLHRGEAPGLPDGRNNRFAHHPSLQLWMAATSYVTATDFYQRVYGRIDFESAQRGYSEFTLIMNCLGAFWHYWDDQVSKLQVSSDAVQLAQSLRDSTDMPRWVQRIKPFLHSATVELLPPKLREAYGLKSTAKTRALYRMMMGFSITVYPALPNKWRAYPLRYYQDRLKTKLTA
ncbi:hypothetical protein N7470_005285 [Penicillium chermesinum]|nr:hypothetical protein N7470_005285 [Penicillium chermesinum]